MLGPTHPPGLDRLGWRAVRRGHPSGHRPAPLQPGIGLVGPAHHRVSTGSTREGTAATYTSPSLTLPTAPSKCRTRPGTEKPRARAANRREISTTWVLRDRLAPRMFEGKRPESSGNTATR
jgi:hypothetical protein